MDVLRKEVCALKVRKMHTKYEKMSKNILSFFINQDGKKCSNYLKPSVL